jgi:hypothetical protein
VSPDLTRIGEGCEGRALAESVTAMVEGASGKGENMAAPVRLRVVVEARNQNLSGSLEWRICQVRGISYDEACDLS